MSIAMGGDSYPPSSLWNVDRVILCRSCAGNHRCCELISAIVVSFLEDTVSPKFSRVSGSHNLYAPFPQCSLNLGEIVGYSCLIYGWAPQRNLFSVFDQLWVPALNVIHYTKLFWQRLRVALIYQYKDQYSITGFISFAY